MLIQKKLIKDMDRAAYNPRVDLRPGDDEYEALKDSLTEFGLVIPIIWNQRTNRVVGGHQRLTVVVKRSPELLVKFFFTFFVNIGIETERRRHQSRGLMCFVFPELSYQHHITPLPCGAIHNISAPRHTDKPPRQRLSAYTRSVFRQKNN